MPDHRKSIFDLYDDTRGLKGPELGIGFPYEVARRPGS